MGGGNKLPQPGPECNMPIRHVYYIRHYFQSIIFTFRRFVPFSIYFYVLSSLFTIQCFVLQLFFTIQCFSSRPLTHLTYCPFDVFFIIGVFSATFCESSEHTEPITRCRWPTKRKPCLIWYASEKGEMYTMFARLQSTYPLFSPRATPSLTINVPLILKVRILFFFRWQNI
jgi:hypothetical protein